MVDITYHQSKLMDDVRGLSFHIDAISQWMKSNKDKKYFEKIPAGYIEQIMK